MYHQNSKPYNWSKIKKNYIFFKFNTISFLFQIQTNNWPEIADRVETADKLAKGVERELEEELEDALLNEEEEEEDNEEDLEGEDWGCRSEEEDLEEEEVEERVLLDTLLPLVWRNRERQITTPNVCTSWCGARIGKIIGKTNNKESNL